MTARHSGFELRFTAIFVLVILQASRSERFGPSALIAIPLTLVVVHFCAIPFSGTSVNPAPWTGIWISFVAPPLGAAVAWAIHAGVVRTGAPGPEAAVAEVLQDA